MRPVSATGGPTALPRTLRLSDLVLLKIVAIVNLSFIPPVAMFGRVTVALWVVAFLTFFVPEAIAVLEYSRRYPGEGGMYLWTRRQFGELHGFVSGWCYWTNNLFYLPMQLVYVAGVLAYAGGPAWAGLVDRKWYVSLVAFGWLAVASIANIRGLAVGKWVQNIGAIAAGVTAVLIIAAGFSAELGGTAATTPLAAGLGWQTLSAFSIMCFAFIGIELASTMGDEIQHPERDLPRAIAIAGGVSLAVYVLVTTAIQALVPGGEMGTIQGVMQAVDRGAARVGLEWIVVPVALAMALSIGGGASAWFAGSARIPFVAGVEGHLPAVFGRIHPRHGSPDVALIVSALLAAAFVAFTLVGSTVLEAYQVLLRAAVVLQLLPFVYLFAGLMLLDGMGAASRAAGAIGLVTTLFGIVSAFIPTSDVESVAVFETKMVLGCVAPTAVGLFLYQRARSRRRHP
jgi:amino acid transporter